MRIKHLLAIIGLGLLVYSNTFFSSFHFDDQIYIVNNFLIRSVPDLLSHWTFYPCRLITFLTLALNYHYNGLHVFGYHVFNLAVHVCAALLVWRLALLTFATPMIKDNELVQHKEIIALFAGLVFVAHPLQTEAVTYIWQRTASLAALFYLASLCLYITSRLSGAKSCYILSLIVAVIAMFTKENAVTLPLMVLLYEWMFFGGQAVWRPKPCVFLMTIFIIPLTLWATHAPQFPPRGSSSWQYLLTQFRVVATYIRLLVLPLNQNIDYDYSLSKSFWEGPVFISFLFLAGILAWAKALFSKYRLLSFAILWFFLTLSLESSILPLKNVIFEHRLYLPMAGYSLFLAAGVCSLGGMENRKMAIVLLTMITALYAVLTYQRNHVWKDELTLWSDAVAKSPHKARAYNNQAYAYYSQNQVEDAMDGYNQAIALDPNLADAYVGRGLVFSQEGNFNAAIADYDKALDLNPHYADAYNNRGIFYEHQHKLVDAIMDLSRAIAIDPYDAKAYYNRGLCYLQRGNATRAMADYNKAIEIDPDDTDAYYNRGLILAQEGFSDEALFDFNKVVHLNPSYADAYNDRGIVYATQGNLTQALSDFNKALAIDPQDREASYNKLRTLKLLPQTPR